MATSPALGWFMLSEADRDAAQRFLSKLSSDGTRDELWLVATPKTNNSSLDAAMSWRELA